MAWLSKEFNWGEGYSRRPIPEYLLLYGGLFVLYALAVYWTLKARPDARALALILLLGLAFRAVLIPSNQIQEDDVYRYLWDGKVFAHQVNPYKYSPDQVTFFKQFMIREPSRFASTYDSSSVRELELLAELKWSDERSLIFMERINHPDLPTIYPPMAQYVFRLVHQAAPDSITALRLGFLIFDLIAAGFILLTLGHLGKNKTWVLIYFWSPLILKETFNSTHLDIIGIAFLTGAVYFLVKARFLTAHLFLAFSVLGKLYPAVLFPFILKEEVRRRGVHAGRVAAAVALFCGTLVVFYLPFLDIGKRVFSSLKSFGTYWQSNDSVFALLVWFYRDVAGIAPKGPVDFSYDAPSLWAKITVVLTLAGVWLFLFFKKETRDARETADQAGSLATVRHLFIIMGLIFLLSPVQNPWYLCWVVPFLCFFPMRSWILLTGLVGLYYLGFYLDYQELNDRQDWIPWFEYLPFYLLLGWDLHRQRQRKLRVTGRASVPQRS